MRVNVRACTSCHGVAMVAAVAALLICTPEQASAVVGLAHPGGGALDCVYVCARLCVRVCVCACVCEHVCVCACVCAHTYVQSYVCVYFLAGARRA